MECSDINSVSGGELVDKILHDDDDLTENLVADLEALQHLQDNSIIHLDLKLKNLLLSRPGSNDITLVDFDLVITYDPDPEKKLVVKPKGNTEFVAPEVANKQPVTLATDFWSLGAICYVLLSGISPFYAESDEETLKKISAGQWSFDPEAFGSISPEAQDFISKLLIVNPSERATVEDCLSHPWIKSADRESQGTRVSADFLRSFSSRRKWQRTTSAVRPSVSLPPSLTSAVKQAVDQSGEQPTTDDQCYKEAVAKAMARVEQDVAEMNAARAAKQHLEKSSEEGFINDKFYANSVKSMHDVNYYEKSSCMILIDDSETAETKADVENCQAEGFDSKLEIMHEYFQFEEYHSLGSKESDVVCSCLVNYCEVPGRLCEGPPGVKSASRKSNVDGCNQTENLGSDVDKPIKTHSEFLLPILGMSPSDNRKAASEPKMEDENESILGEETDNISIVEMPDTNHNDVNNEEMKTTKKCTVNNPKISSVVEQLLKVKKQKENEKAIAKKAEEAVKKNDLETQSRPTVDVSVKLPEKQQEKSKAIEVVNVLTKRPNKKVTFRKTSLPEIVTPPRFQDTDSMTEDELVHHILNFLKEKHANDAALNLTPGQKLKWQRPYLYNLVSGFIFGCILGIVYCLFRYLVI